MEPLRSAANPRVRRLKALLAEAKERRREGRWVAEGLRLAEEAAGSGLALEAAFVTEEFRGEREDALLERLRGRGVEFVPLARGVLREISDTQAPQGIALVLEAPRWDWEDLAGPGPILILDRLQDPGNVGALARSLAAAGGAGLVLCPETADPGNPKALRASAGALFRLPFVRAGEPAETARRLGRPLYVTSGAGGSLPEALPLHEPFALVLGQEGGGVADPWRALAAAGVTIPMEAAVESLNVAAAGAVLVFEAARRRRSLN